MIVHGIPSEKVVLVEGDIISIDCGAIIEGYHGDAAYTAGVGDISPEARKLIEVTDASLVAGIKAMVDGNRLSDIGHAVQTVAEAGGSTRSCVSTSVTRSAPRCTKTRRCRTMGRRAKGPKLRKRHGLRD